MASAKPSKPSLSPFTITAAGPRVAVRLSPKSSHNTVVGIEDDGRGGAVLKVKVTAAPEHGKANKALIKLLSKSWRLPASSISLVSGAKDRNKVLLIEGDGRALVAKLSEWAAREVTKK